MSKSTLLQPTIDKKQIKQLIVFRVSDEEFGVPIEAIQEIIKVGMITPIPDSPEFIEGLINVRGDVVATINVRARFFLPPTVNASKHIVIAKHEDSLFGLMVDEVMEVLRIQESEIKSPPHLITKINEDYVGGVVTHEGRLIILLDVAQLLSEKELSKLAEMMRRRHKQIKVTSSDEPKLSSSLPTAKNAKSGKDKIGLNLKRKKTK